MSQIVFFLTRLHSEDGRDAYEKWVREIDQPLADALPGVARYRVVRLEDEVLDGVGTSTYSYIEIIEVEDLDAYRTAIAGTPASFFAEFRSHISGFDAVTGTVVQ